MLNHHPVLFLLLNPSANNTPIESPTKQPSISSKNHGVQESNGITSMQSPHGIKNFDKIKLEESKVDG